MTFVALFAALAGNFGPQNPYQPPPQPMPSQVTPSGNDLVIAASLLAAPWGVQEAEPSPERFPYLAEAVRDVAIAWEIMDKRETSWLLTRGKNFCDDVNTLRRRRDELVGAPPAGDWLRFPSRDYVNEAVRFNRAFRKNVEERLPLDPQRVAIYRTVLRETDELYEVWGAARDAQCPFYYVQVRRAALAKLRDLIGEEAYLSGHMPPCAPTWRFNELR